MNLRRIAVAVLWALAIGWVLAPMTSQAGVTSVHPAFRSSPCHQGVAAAATPLSFGAQCIPCSAKKPCVNPLTVCSYRNGSTHGCCLGFAGGLS